LKIDAPGSALFKDSEVSSSHRESLRFTNFYETLGQVKTKKHRLSDSARSDDASPTRLTRIEGTMLVNSLIDNEMLQVDQAEYMAVARE